MAMIWQGALAALLVRLGIGLNGAMRFLPLRSFGGYRRALQNSRKSGAGELSPLQALATGLAGAVGVGNLSGVACAITVGGAGALLWMVLAALLGMGVAFAEGVLAARTPHCGAVGYIRAAGFPRGARLFCWACVLSAVGMGGMAQANAAVDALQVWGVPPGIAAAAVVFPLLGLAGRRLPQAGRAAEKLVPLMTGMFLVLSLGVLVRFSGEILPAAGRIVREALGLRPCLGGAAGYCAMRAFSQGVVRGAFTNEAGLGSGTFAYGACRGDPVHMGALAAVQVVLDTVFLCTVTGFCLLCAGWDAGLDGAALCLCAYGRAWGGVGQGALAVCMLLFAWAAMLAWSAYGREAMEELVPGQGRFFGLLFAAASAAGALMPAAGTLAVCDLFNLLMALPNACALWRSRKIAARAASELAGHTHADLAEN